MNPRMRPSPLLLCAALACGNDNLSTGDALTTSFASATSPLDSTSHPTSTSTPTSTGTSTSTSTGSSTGDAPCPTDTILCDGLTAKVCDGLGGFKAMEPCPIACIPDIGCAPCVPDTRTCDGDLALKCSAAGNFEPAEHCDPVQGLSCDPELGACAGACADLGRSYIGCEYYPTTVQQAEGYMAPKFVFAVAVANTDDTTATVTVTRGAAMVAQVEVQPTSVQLIELPWVTELSDNNIGPTIRVSDGAYRLRSTRPVTVYQYNPLTVSFSNDASLLLPTNTWTGNYLVAAWPTINKLVPGIYAVTARHDNTTVTLQPSATGKSVKPGAGVAEDGSGVVILDEGDVLQVLSVATGDLTGTIVAADKPVQVIGGHKCTFVPLSTPACDHLEESMFPIETLAREYVIVPPVQVPDDTAEKGQIVRIIASEANTTLTFTPEQPVAKLLFNAGDFVELPPTIARFVVSADKKILVAQYMVGQDGGYGTSDPAMLLAVSPQQWRDNYLFHAPINWDANYVDIIAPKNAVVTVDASEVGNWQPVGATNYEVAHVKLNGDNGGNHSVVASVGVGISVYGVQNYGSYWYPGGLDLAVIPQ